MTAVASHDVGSICLEDIPESRLQQPADAIVRITASAICGTDLHFVRGTFAGMQEGTAPGHEGIGIVAFPEDGTDGQAILLPDIFPAGYSGAGRAGGTAS